VHYEASEYTNYSDHDAHAKSHYEADYAEKDKYYGEGDEYAKELPHGGYEGHELQGLPHGFENFDHDYKGSEYEGKDFEGKDYDYGKDHDYKGDDYDKDYDYKDDYKGAEYQGDPRAVESVVGK
jgi:hypothetical protein